MEGAEPPVPGTHLLLIDKSDKGRTIRCMAKREFTLTDAQEASLQQASLRTKDGPTRTRYQAVRLYGLGYPVPQIQEITGCSRTSLLDWCRLYRLRGVPGLVDGRRGGNRAKLTSAQRDLVRAN